MLDLDISDDESQMDLNNIED